MSQKPLWEITHDRLMKFREQVAELRLLDGLSLERAVAVVTDGERFTTPDLKATFRKWLAGKLTELEGNQ